MAEDLQGKINSIKTKGLDNLTKEEYINYLHLKKKLLAVSKVRTAQAKARIAEITKTNKKLDEIGTLLK